VEGTYLKFVWGDHEIFCREQNPISVFSRYPLFIVWTPGQCVGSIRVSGLWNDFKIESGQEYGPSSLAAGENLFSSEILEVCMVGEDLCLVFVAL
jgi:hypothetical protein